MSVQPPPPPPHPAAGVAARREGELARLWRTSGHSYDGFCNAWRHERSVRLEVVALAVLVPLALWLPIGLVERVVLLCSMLAVLAVELLNTAIERVVDRIGTERHPLSGQAKDIGSAAVAVTLLASFIAWVAFAGPVAWAWLRAAKG